MDKTSALERLHKIDGERRRIAQVQALLQWDQETMLPDAAVEGRAEQMAAIEGILHQRGTAPEIGRLLGRLGSSAAAPRGDEALPETERDFLRVLRRAYDREVCLPADLVVDAARAEGLSQAAWVRARQNGDFSVFVPHLRTMVSFARRKAELWGFSERPYDGLLDLHEPGMGAAGIDAVFTPLRERLSLLVRRIGAQPRPEAGFLKNEFPVAGQDAFGRALMASLGFDTRRGRLDLSVHPFTTSLGPDDVRITTRYFPDNMLSGLFSIIHETGHALYEMGFDPAFRDSSLADGASMGIHESQSRLWENVIGRSLPFWEGRYPELAQRFPHQLAGVTAADFYRAVNEVRPSLIRVDADEVTYSLHVILRFELEKKLFSGALAVEDLPEAWRQGMMDLLGTAADDDADGVLQDVHWSMGAFGYFPSYALGNLYGLQFWRALRRDVAAVDDRIRSGDFKEILDWLRQKIHVRGARLEPENLLREVTGQTLNADAFMEYLETKYTALYAL